MTLCNPMCASLFRFQSTSPCVPLQFSLLKTTEKNQFFIEFLIAQIVITSIWTVCYFRGDTNMKKYFKYSLGLYLPKIMYKHGTATGNYLQLGKLFDDKFWIHSCPDLLLEFQLLYILFQYTFTFNSSLYAIYDFRRV